MHDSIRMRELYADNLDAFSTILENEKCGRRLSARILPNTKLLIILGQDKATFKQFQNIGKALA